MPRRLKLLSEIPKGLVAWDAAHRAFKDNNGGEGLSTARGVGAFMRLFPGEVEIKALWGWETFKGNPFALRQWVRGRTKLLVNWEAASHKSIHRLKTPNQGLARNLTSTNFTASYRI